MEEVKEYIPRDTSQQMTLMKYLLFLFKNKSINGRGDILDFGCGDGSSYFDIMKQLPEITWHGIDVIDSTNGSIVREKIKIYSGDKIPFEDAVFDVIFTNQVFEHIEQPFTTIIELERVLKPNGIIIGSVSQLEPYHSKSVFNYTPYGLCQLLKGTSLSMVEFRPGIDSLTLIIRALFGKKKFFSRYWNKESPLNKIFSIYGKIFRKSSFSINYYKLFFCGQFCFCIRKL